MTGRKNVSSWSSLSSNLTRWQTKSFPTPLSISTSLQRKTNKLAIKTALIQGKARWAKVLGAAPPGYDNGPAEWSLDVVLDEKGQKDFLSSGADKFYLKTDNKTGEVFVKFSRKAVKQDGTEAKPIKVVDHHGDEWNQSTLIGNGSTLNIQFTLNTVKSKGVMRNK